MTYRLDVNLLIGLIDPAHIGHHGVDAEYDQLQSWLDDQIVRLQALPIPYKAKFRELPGQEGLPHAMLRELEVAWTPSSAQAQNGPRTFHLAATDQPQQPPLPPPK